MTLLAVLRDARELVALPDNDFSWSSWLGTEDALKEIDGLIEQVRAGEVDPHAVAIVFAPAGPMQELALSSGWSDRFAEIADRMDAAQQSFRCAVCRGLAGVIQVLDSELRREAHTGVMRQPVAGRGLERLQAAMASGSAAAIHAFDPELAPFYCPRCDRSYCGEHWSRSYVWDDELPDRLDSIRGRCPEGHERMLED